MEDDGAVEGGERTRRLVLRGPRVDDDRLAELQGQGQLPLEELALSFVRGIVAVEVEAGLTYRDRALVSQQLAQLGEASRVLVAGLVRVDPEGRVHLLVLVREGERRAARGDSRANGDDPRDACVLRAPDERRGTVR